MTTGAGTHGDLFAWAKDLERENTRIAETNAVRVRNRGRREPVETPSLVSPGRTCLLSLSNRLS